MSVVEVIASDVQVVEVEGQAPNVEVYEAEGVPSVEVLSDEEPVVEVVQTGGPVSDSPNDSKLYGRRDGQWVEIDIQSSGSRITLVAGEAISALRVVYYRDGAIFHASPEIAECFGTVVGVSLTGSLQGGDVLVQLSGDLTDPYLDFDLLQAVFMGEEGRIVTIPPVSGVLQQIGVSIEQHRMVIDLKQPVLLQ